MPTPVLQFPVAESEWENELDRVDGTNKLLNNANNVALLLCNTEDWKGRVWYDLFSEDLKCDNHTWTDRDTTQVQRWLQRTQGLKTITKATIDDGIKMAGEEQRINVLTDYLDNLVWDPESQIGINCWLTDYFGVKDTPLNRAFGRAWLVSAVARAFEPGCQVDHCLIFEGNQGIGKSTALRMLAGDVFYAQFNVANLADKEAYDRCRGKWILEFSELGAIRTNRAESVKAFMSSVGDHYRKAYDRHATTVKRTCVFAGTTNETHYLEDDTGNRRYWPVRCRWASADKIKRDRDQLWAHAVHIYRTEHMWHLTPEMEKLAKAAQAARIEIDAWTEAVQKYVATHADVSLAEIMEHGLDKPHYTPKDTQRLGRLLRAIGWDWYPTTGGKNLHRWRHAPKNHRPPIMEIISNID